MAIKEFLATVKGRGFAKSSKYMVVIDLPKGPSANNQGRVNVWGGMTSGGNQFSNYSQMVDGQRLVSLYCEAVSLPSLNIDTKLNKVYGPGREMPYGVSYTPVNLSFYIDRDYLVKRFFDTWQRSIIDEDTHHANFYNEYVTQVHILALDAKEGQSVEDPRFAGFDSTPGGSFRARYQCTLVEAYPKTVAEVAYSAGNTEVAKLQVSMQYRRWTETTAPFGIGTIQSMEKSPEYIIYNPAQGTFRADTSATRFNDAGISI